MLVFNQPSYIPNSMLRLTKVCQTGYYQMWWVTYLTPSRAARFQGPKSIGCIADDKYVWVFREPDLSIIHFSPKL